MYKEIKIVQVLFYIRSCTILIDFDIQFGYNKIENNQIGYCGDRNEIYDKRIERYDRDDAKSICRKI